jgi:hypothetical protein
MITSKDDMTWIFDNHRIEPYLRLPGSIVFEWYRSTWGEEVMQEGFSCGI